MKFIKLLLSAFIFSVFLLNTPVFAAVDNNTLDGLNATAKGVTAYQDQIKENPRTALLARVGGIVGLALSFVGIIFLVLTVYAGIMWMTAQGNSGQVDKAKDLLINAVIGLIIISAAYSITIFVGQELVNK